MIAVARISRQTFDRPAFRSSTFDVLRLRLYLVATAAKIAHVLPTFNTSAFDILGILVGNVIVLVSATFLLSTVRLLLLLLLLVLVGRLGEGIARLELERRGINICTCTALSEEVGVGQVGELQRGRLAIFRQAIFIARRLGAPVRLVGFVAIGHGVAAKITAITAAIIGTNIAAIIGANIAAEIPGHCPGTHSSAFFTLHLSLVPNRLPLPLPLPLGASGLVQLVRRLLLRLLLLLLLLLVAVLGLGGAFHSPAFAVGVRLVERSLLLLLLLLAWVDVARISGQASFDRPAF